MNTPMAISTAPTMVTKPNLNNGRFTLSVESLTEEKTLKLPSLNVKYSNMDIKNENPIVAMMAAIRGSGFH